LTIAGRAASRRCSWHCNAAAAALPAEPRVELDFYRMDNAPCHHH
jgi:hypothetical protein